LLELGSFDMHMNTTAPMLGHSEVDMEVSDTGMETTESDNYREISGDNGDVNGILTMI